LVIGKVGAFKVGVLFSVSLVILDEAAAKPADKLAQIPDFHPALAAELLAIVHRECDVTLDPVGS
jgi:hypothetical protein